MMNDAELGLVIESLQDLVGLPFGGAWQPSRDRVILEIGHRFLLLVPRGPFARIHTVPRRPANPQKPFSFQGAVRSRIRGRLSAIDRIDSDRIVDLQFESGRLHLRLTGRRGGLWLIEGSDVLAAYDGPAPPELPAVPPRPLRDDPPRFARAPEESWDRAAGRHFDTAERLDRTLQVRTQLTKAIRTDISRSVRLLENLEGDLDRASRAPTLRRQADALAAGLHAIPRGARAAVLQDLEDPERTWNVELDPSRPASDAMERLYRQARRLDRTGDQVLERMEQVERRLEILRAAAEEALGADLSRLLELRALVPTAGTRGDPTGAIAPFITWTGPHGEVVRVGRNERSNRQLTFQRSKGSDWWMHLRSVPGAHLVLPTVRDQSPPLELLLAAAQVALVHGRIQEGASADVQYTRVRDVRSIPGESTGRVRVANERVLHVVRDPSVLVGWSRDA